MSDKEWTPANIGGRRIKWDYAAPGVGEGWEFDRALTEEERRLATDYLMRNHPACAVAPGWIGGSGVKPWCYGDSLKAWSPAQLGDQLIEWKCSLGAHLPWRAAKAIENQDPDELALTVRDARAMAAELPSHHPFKSPPDDTARLAPDHPWRKGTIPKP